MSISPIATMSMYRCAPDTCTVCTRTLHVLFSANAAISDIPGPANIMSVWTSSRSTQVHRYYCTQCISAMCKFPHLCLLSPFPHVLWSNILVSIAIAERMTLACPTGAFPSRSAIDTYVHTPYMENYQTSDYLQQGGSCLDLSFGLGRTTLVHRSTE